MVRRRASWVFSLTWTLTDEEGKDRIRAFTQALDKRGWIEGRNLHTEIRWAGESVERYREYAKELVALKPDVLLASASPGVVALQQVTRDVPIIFANVIDPVGAGFVMSLARPGGNTTGFTAFEYSISGKWLELLKECRPPSKAGCCGSRSVDSRWNRSVRRNPDTWHQSLRL